MRLDELQQRELGCHEQQAAGEDHDPPDHEAHRGLRPALPDGRLAVLGLDEEEDHPADERAGRDKPPRVPRGILSDSHFRRTCENASGAQPSEEGIQGLKSLKLHVYSD